MSVMGEDFAGGWFRPLYRPVNPGGLGYALGVAAILLLADQALQVVFSLSLMKLLHIDTGNTREVVKVSLAIIFPASLIVVALGWWLAGRRGGEPARVLSLRRPRLSGLGWAALLICFIIVMYASIMSIVLALGIDLTQYTPGPNGQSPHSGSAGLVKEAMFDIANEPLLFLAVYPSIAIGAPLAEEVIFRGQLFSALSTTRLGVAGTTVLTSALWALLHVTEPWLSIGLIFVMGLLFGWMMWRFGSLWVTIICHGVWNGLYALLIFASAGGST